jgi:hypothetical protein
VSETLLFWRLRGFVRIGQPEGLVDELQSRAYFARLVESHNSGPPGSPRDSDWPRCFFSSITAKRCRKRLLEDAGPETFLDLGDQKLGISLPSPCEPSLTICRSYSPVHNIGHFRFLECTHRSPLGAPSGEVAIWDEIRFPFDPALASAPDLHTTAVAHSPEASSQLIEERYECDSGGSMTVTIANRTAAYSRTYCLGRWSLNSKSVKPVRKGKGKQ